MNIPPAQLSCQQCQRRKTKCNKTTPCSACLTAGIPCTAVQRHRRPRGRSGKQKHDKPGQQSLQNRVSHLESIISDLRRTGSSNQAELTSKNGSEKNSQSPSQTITTPVESFLAPDFWVELSDAVAGLRDALEVDNVDGNEEDFQHLQPENGAFNSTDLEPQPNAILFGPQGRNPESGSNAPSWLEERLLDVYRDRVHTIFKSLHWPTALSLLRQPRDEKISDRNVLESAIYFTATCSLFDHELEGRRELITHFQRTTEEAFVEANLLTTTSITVLQAFVVYLAGLRACQANAQQWTLTATAVRIARSLGIERPSSVSESMLNAEVRKRVWFSIGVLDLQSAFDRGSQPLLSSGDFTALPLEIDDEDLSMTTLPPTVHLVPTSFTEWTLPLTMYKAGICQRRLTEIGSMANSADSAATIMTAGFDQLAVLADFETYTKHISGLCDESPTPIRSFALAVASESLVAMKMLSYRPLYPTKGGIVPVRFIPSAQIDLLRTATEILERSQMKRTRYEFAPWAWFGWVKWFALAVALAELCAAQGPGADHAWEIAQVSYQDYAQTVADTKSGLLWKPIKKLMQKAKGGREERTMLQATKSFNVMWPDFGQGDQQQGHYQSASTSNQSALGNEELNEEFSAAEDMSWVYWEALIADLGDPDSTSDMVF